MRNQLWWIFLILFAVLIVSFLLCGVAGCQYSYYEARTIDPNDGQCSELVKVGTWEVCVIDSKNALAIKLYDGTELSLGSTTTQTDAEMMKAMMELVKELKAWYDVVPPIVIDSNK